MQQDPPPQLQLTYVGTTTYQSNPEADKHTVAARLGVMGSLQQLLYHLDDIGRWLLIPVLIQGCRGHTAALVQPDWTI